MKEPQVTVGIMSERQIRFVFNGTYLANGVPVSGEHEAHTDGKQIFWNGNRYTRIVFTPEKEDYSFCLKEVTIGVKFHWERKEDQTFKGNLNLIVENGLITAINALSVEEYLLSVISSEMSATASLELLKSHAVISRSWLLAQIRKNKELAGEKTDSLIRTDKELIHWYDREDHINFDVCADDHCQRYQGITRACTEVVAQAIPATHGEVLTYDGEICDARFSKCCGGVVEEFSSCWENINPPYLTALRDDKNEKDFPDLKNEDIARQWIYTSPTAFCNTTDKKILSQVLNNYDQETTDFYRRSGKIPALRLFPNRQYPAVYRFRQSFLGMVWSHSPLGVFHRYPGKPESLDTIHVLGMLSRNVHVFYRIRSRHTFLLARSPERLSSLPVQEAMVQVAPHHGFLLRYICLHVDTERLYVHGSASFVALRQTGLPRIPPKPG